MTFQLVGKLGKSKGVHWPLEQPSTVLGRSGDCDIVVADESVSRHHCEFRNQGDELTLTILSDENGCLVNGIPMTSCRLSPGDEVAIGTSIFFVTRNVAGGHSVPGSASEAKTIALAGLDSEYAQELNAASEGQHDVRTIHDLHDLYMLSLLLGEAVSYSEAVWIVRDFAAKNFSGCRSFVYLKDGAAVDGAFDLNLAGGPDTANPQRDELLKQSISEKKSYLRKGVFRKGEGSELTAVLVAPMLIRGETLGALVIEGVNEKGRLDGQDLKFLTAMGRTAATHFRSLSENQELERECSFLRRNQGEELNLVGESRAIGRVRGAIRQAARSDLSVLLQGETGTGKELAARLIHKHGGHSEGRFVVVNCPAIPNELFESQLFGHEAGAFTGAHERHIGLVEQADGGTLFFDEIGDLRMSHQARVLRVIEDGVFRRVGGAEDIRADFRVIAATNSDLARAVERHVFREDLFHRVNAFEIRLPPLRERPADVPALAEEFLRQYAEATAGRELKLTREAVEALKGMPLRGNVRELKNRVHRAASLAKDGKLKASDFASPSSSVSPEGDAPVNGSLREAEKNHIIAVLKDCKGKVSEATKILEISRSTLYKKIGDHGIKT